MVKLSGSVTSGWLICMELDVRRRSGARCGVVHDVVPRRLMTSLKSWPPRFGITRRTRRPSSVHRRNAASAAVRPGPSLSTAMTTRLNSGGRASEQPRLPAAMADQPAVQTPPAGAGDGLQFLAGDEFSCRQHGGE